MSTNGFTSETLKNIRWIGDNHYGLNKHLTLYIRNNKDGNSWSSVQRMNHLTSPNEKGVYVPTKLSVQPRTTQSIVDGLNYLEISDVSKRTFSKSCTINGFVGEIPIATCKSVNTARKLSQKMNGKKTTPNKQCICKSAHKMIGVIPNFSKNAKKLM